MDDEQESLRRVERTLVRKLASRQLSIAEARTAAVKEGLPREAVDGLIADFEGRGYLDDVALAQQLADAGVERKGQGRHAIASALAGRGIARDIVQTVLAELPDDDEERALAFARTKVRSVGGRDDDAALRRLVGQLARRGYNSSLAFRAARQALDERNAGPRGPFFH